MARVLAPVLSLCLLISASALRMGSTSQSGLESVVAEVGRRCKSEDFAGALDVLEAHGSPVGGQQGKELMKSCFMNNDGECTVGDAQCAWMQKCFSMDKPCGPPPMKETLHEIPGGQAVLAELASKSNSSNALKVGMSTLMASLKRLEKQLPGDKTQLGRIFWDQFKWRAFIAKGARNKWMHYLPAQKHRLWFYQLGTMGLWFTLACAAQYSNVKMIGPPPPLPGSKRYRPVYSWFAPHGIYKNPVYTYPIIVAKFSKFPNWNCWQDLPEQDKPKNALLAPGDVQALTNVALTPWDGAPGFGSDR